MKILYLAEEEGFNQKHFDHFSGRLTEGQSIVIGPKAGNGIPFSSMTLA